MKMAPANFLYLLSFLLLTAATKAVPTSVFSSPPTIPSRLPPLNGTACSPTVWYIGRFHKFHTDAPPAIPYLAFYFSMYDTTGEMGTASCSLTGTPGSRIENSLYPFDPNTWHPCHKVGRPKGEVDSPGGRSDYQFQWNDYEQTLWVRGKGKCGQHEVRQHKVPPIAEGRLPYFYFDNMDLGDNSVSPQAFYEIYGRDGSFKLTHDANGASIPGTDW